ncbi:MAG: SDR family NAD(P)-dependent oxidoreductase [Leucobacter sp.]
MPSPAVASAANAASFRGRTALVTGSSDGIGFQIARALAAAGARVLMPVRNRRKGERAMARILSDAPAARLELLDLELLDLDLARLDSVAALASMLVLRGEPIELLVLNAGVVQLAEQDRQLTRDGFELAFQTNFLGHFALTLGLLPLLRAGGARVAVQCSVAAAGARVRWGDLSGEARGASPGSRGYRPFRAYRTSKAALGLFGLELARRSAAAGWGVSVHLCHPGIAPGSAIAPKLRAMFPRSLVEWAVAHLGNPPHAAAQTALAALAAAPRTEPRMFVPGGPLELAGTPRERAPFSSLDRPGDARMMWDLASRWAGGAFA